MWHIKLICSNGEFTLALPTVRGQVYALETTSSLDGSNWTAFPLVLGDGSIKKLSHRPLDSTQQFYRVRRWCRRRRTAQRP